MPSENTDALTELAVIGKSLLKELKELHQTIKERNGNRKATVNSSVAALMIKFTDARWTAESLAARIGCSVSAVKQSRSWKTYRKQIKSAKWDNHRTDVVYDDYDEIDARLDNEKEQ